MERWLVLVDDPDSDRLSGELPDQVLEGGFGCRPGPNPGFQREVVTSQGRMPARSGGRFPFLWSLRRLMEGGLEAGYVE